MVFKSRYISSRIRKSKENAKGVSLYSVVEC